jgi:hypothetical protein
LENKSKENPIMVDFNEYPINFLLAGLFIIAMVSFGVGLAQNYGYEGALMKSDKVDFSGLENQVNQTSSDAQGWATTFKSDNLFVSAGGIVLFSIWGIGKLIFGSIISFATIFTDGLQGVFGVPPIVTGVIMAILIISLIFSLWKLIKVGN